jgi:hypothetical protein
MYIYIIIMAHPANVEMFKDPNINHMLIDYANDGYTPEQALEFIYDANYSALFNKPGMDDQKPKRKQLILDDIDNAKRHNRERTTAAMSKDPLFKPMITKLGIELNNEDNVIEKVLDILHDSNFTVAMINDPTIRAAIELMQEDGVAVEKIFDTIRKSKMGMAVAVKELHKKSAKKPIKKKSAKKPIKKKSAKKPIKKKSAKKPIKKKSAKKPIKKKSAKH